MTKKCQCYYYLDIYISNYWQLPNISTFWTKFYSILLTYIIIEIILQGFISGSQVVSIYGKDEWKYLYQEQDGEERVQIVGMTMMLQLYVNNWDFQLVVSG